LEHKESHWIEIPLDDVQGISLSHNYSSPNFNDQRLTAFGKNKEECFFRLREFYRKLGEELEKSLDE